MNRIINRLDQIDYKKLIWLFAITETIHNLEEAIWLPEWSQTVSIGIWQSPVGTFEFRFAVALLTVLFYVLIYFFSKYESRYLNALMGGVLLMVIFNVFIPHLIATIITFDLVPGVISGLLLNVPVCLYLLWRGLNEGIYETRTLLLSGLALTVIALPLLQVLFIMGRLIIS